MFTLYKTQESHEVKDYRVLIKRLCGYLGNITVNTRLEPTIGDRFHKSAVLEKIFSNETYVSLMEFVEIEGGSGQCHYWF